MCMWFFYANKAIIQFISEKKNKNLDQNFVSPPTPPQEIIKEISKPLD